MSLWLCRAGKYGEREDFALESNRVVIGWEDVADLHLINSREALFELLQASFSNKKVKTLENWRNQLWAFRQTMQVGDLVVLPLKTRSQVAIGRVTGEYEYDQTGLSKHWRAVRWLRKDVPRPSISQDLLYSIGAAQTVCKIQRNNAEARFEALADGQPDRGPKPQQELSSEATNDTADPSNIDVEEYAADKLRSFLQERFAGHSLARLVDGVLIAQGFKTFLSPAGPDGGVDILAGRGEMGFDAPRICVQVKSQQSVLDVTALRELQAVVTNFGAQQGLLVAWGGFNRALEKEARRLFFHIRLWDAGDLLENLLSSYDKLSLELQSELPLKRIWTLVDPEEAEDDE